MFVFTQYEANWETGTLQFYYEVIQGSKHIPFMERWQLGSIFETSHIPPSVLDASLQALHLILGASYYKAYCPPSIQINNYSLSYGQAEMWNTIYTKGLGEFFYKNNIDYRGLLQFPFAENIEIAEPSRMNFDERALVLHGGGKDSIVSTEIVREAGVDFDLFCLNPKDIQMDVARRMNKNVLTISRKLDPKLLDLNVSGGVYNGHVPISTVYTFAAVLQAIIGNYRYIVISSERSSNYGNVTYLGEVINHQWSKSSEAEKLLANYITTYITPDLAYFSMLRPWYEIKVTEKFSKLSNYFDVFSSSNHNFKLDASGEIHRWEYDSPKTVFVYTMLTAFLSKDEMLRIFGDNLYDMTSLMPHFKQLLGLESIKPFECVGTPEEMMVAMKIAYDKGEYEGNIAMQLFKDNILSMNKNFDDMKAKVFADGDKSGIPKKFKAII